MNINLLNFNSLNSSFSTKSFLPPVFTDLQKKVSVIALIVIAAVAAFYLIIRTVKPHLVDETGGFDDMKPPPPPDIESGLISPPKILPSQQPDPSIPGKGGASVPGDTIDKDEKTKPAIPPSPLKLFHLDAENEYPQIDQNEGSDLEDERSMPPTPGTPLEEDDPGRTWEENSSIWADQLLNLESKYIQQHTELGAQQKKLKQIEQEKSSLSYTLQNLEKQIPEEREKEKAAHDRLTNMMKKQGAAHVNQATEQLEGDWVFPNGAKLTAMFKAWAKSEASNQILSLAKLQSNSGISISIAMDIVLPLFEASKNYVKDILDTKQKRLIAIFGEKAQFAARDHNDVAWLFFLHTQQRIIPKEIAVMTNEDLIQIPVKFDKNISTLLENPQNGNALKLDMHELLRKFIHFHALVELSDPPCYLHPAPGTHIKYQESFARCLGANSKSSNIKADEMVEVLIPGLYLKNPQVTALELPLPAVKAVVRKLS